jgi:hypothetical protein
MNHDFTDPFTSPKTVLRDSAGNSCTDSNGVMDYYVTVQKWTTCSVERFTQVPISRRISASAEKVFGQIFILHTLSFGKNFTQNLQGKFYDM